MIQYRGSLKRFFTNEEDKSKSKWAITNHHLFLNLKKVCVYFSKKINNESRYLKETEVVSVKIVIFSLTVLLVDFLRLIKQKFVKKNGVLYKYTIEDSLNISKNTDVFIKNTVYIFPPQYNLKQQKK